MIELTQWAGSFPLLARPWLILGKGPSFSQAKHVDLHPYYTMSLNHVVREMSVHTAHFADLDALEDCSDEVLANAQWVLMPFRPHVRFSPGPKALPDLISSVPALKKLERAGRLVWYNLSTGEPFGNSPIIQTGLFGSEVVVNILALLGVKTIRTLGIDGGRTYSPDFRDLEKKTLLNHGAQSFDLQFTGILKTVERYCIDFAPLAEPIRVFIGTDESQAIPARVLEYTIRKHASRPVEVYHLDKVDVPMPRAPENQPRTAFSFKRFAIPMLCQYHGQAIYLDSDMIVFSDIAELWNTPMESCSVLCTWQDAPPDGWRDHAFFQTGRQMSVLLLDCGKLRWDPAEIVRGLDDELYSYAQLMFDLCIVRPDEIASTLSSDWNALEYFEPGKTKLLHYTVVPTQPWLSNDNPLEHLWTSQFAEALVAGAISAEDVQQAIVKGYIKPSLAVCLSIREDNLGGARADAFATPQGPLPLWELRTRAAYGQALIDQARVPQLEREINMLKRRIDSMSNSWTWRCGSIITHPISALGKLYRYLLRRRPNRSQIA
jgi:Glycosyl transferase family 8